MNFGYLTLTLMFVGIMLAFDQVPMLFFSAVFAVTMMMIIGKSK